MKNVHLQKGTLLASRGVFLSKGCWPNKAYGDAEELMRRLKPTLIDYRFDYPGVVNQGNYPQEFWTPGAATGPVRLPPAEGLPEMDEPENQEDTGGQQDEVATSSSTHPVQVLLPPFVN